MQLLEDFTILPSSKRFPVPFEYFESNEYGHRKERFIDPPLDDKRLIGEITDKRSIETL